MTTVPSNERNLPPCTPMRQASFRKQNVQLRVSTDTIETAEMRSDEGEEGEEATSHQDDTDFDEDSTIVSSTRSVDSYDDHDCCDFSHVDEDTSESTVDADGILPLGFNDSATFAWNETSPENSSTDLSPIHRSFVHQNSVKIMIHTTMSGTPTEGTYTTTEQCKGEDDVGSKPKPKQSDAHDTENGSRSTNDKLSTTKSPMSLPHFRAQQRRKLLQRSAVPTSRCSTIGTKKSHRRFARARRMSLGEMETVIDTVFRSVKSLTNGSQRRLSFGYAAEKEFDRSDPACEIARGCLTRMDAWAKRGGEAGDAGGGRREQQQQRQRGPEHARDDPDEDLPEDATGSTKRSKRVKSILKFFPKYSRSLQRRPSFFDKKKSSDNQKEAPKRPGRRNSLTVSTDTDQPMTAPPSTNTTAVPTPTAATGIASNRSMFARNTSADRQLLAQVRRRFQSTNSADLGTKRI